MSNSTTTTNLNNELKEAAKTKGYNYVRKAFCPDCAKYIEELEQEKHTYFHWADPVCALFFSKKGAPSIVACACGYREKIQPKAKREVVHCKTDGCNSIVSKKELEDNNGYCWKCKPTQKTSRPAPEKKANMGKAPKAARICTTNGCSNELPEDRKSYCYTCRPKATSKTSKEAAQEVVM